MLGYQVVERGERVGREEAGETFAGGEEAFAHACPLGSHNVIEPCFPTGSM